MRSNADSSEHSATGWIDLDHIKFIIKGYTLRVRADVDLAPSVECYVVELATVLPLAEEFPVKIKPLQPPVLPVRCIEKALRAYSDRMNHVELAGPGARATPLAYLPAAGVVLDDAGIAVAVRHEHTAVRRERDVCAGSGTSPTLISRSFCPCAVNL